MSTDWPTQCLKEYELVANLEKMGDTACKFRYWDSFEKLEDKATIDPKLCGGDTLAEASGPQVTK